MANGNVTTDLLYRELVQMRRELRELKSVFIPEERISEAERKELRALFKEIEEGNGRPWREISKA